MESEDKLKKMNLKLIQSEEKEGKLTIELAHALEEIEKLKVEIKFGSENKKNSNYISLSNMLVDSNKSEETPKKHEPIVNIPKVESTRQEKNKTTNLMIKVSEKEDEIIKLMCDLKTAQSKIDSLDKNLKTSIMQYDNSFNEKKDLIKELEEFRKNAEEAEERVKHLEIEVKNKGIEVHQLEQLLDSSNRTIYELRQNASNSTLINKLEELKKQNESYKERLSHSENDIMQLIKVKQENEELLDTIADLKKSYESAAEKIELLESRSEERRVGK